MSSETRRSRSTDEPEEEKDSTGHLHYPKNRTQAALERWHSEMMLFLGGKELAHVATDTSDLDSMTEKMRMKQAVLMSVLLGGRGCLRKQTNLREHLLRTQTGEHAVVALQQHGARMLAVMRMGIPSMPIPNELQVLSTWELAKMRTMKLDKKATQKDVRAYTKALDEAIKNATDEVTLDDYMLILDRAIDPGSGEYERDGWHRYWSKYASDVIAMGRELAMLEARTAFETWWAGQESDQHLRAQMPTFSARSDSESSRTPWRRSPTPRATAKAAEIEEKDEEDDGEPTEHEKVALACEHCDGTCKAEIVFEDGERKVAYAAAYCDGCGYTHAWGCWAECDVERDPGAEERLRVRDPERLNRLNKLREEDCRRKQGTAGGSTQRSPGGQPEKPRARVPPVPAQNRGAPRGAPPTPANRRKLALMAMNESRTALAAQLAELDEKVKSMMDEDEAEEQGEEDDKPGRRKMRFAMSAVRSNGDEDEYDLDEKTAMMAERSSSGESDMEELEETSREQDHESLKEEFEEDNNNEAAFDDHPVGPTGRQAPKPSTSGLPNPLMHAQGWTHWGGDLNDSSEEEVQQWINGEPTHKVSHTMMMQRWDHWKAISEEIACWRMLGEQSQMRACVRTWRRATTGVTLRQWKNIENDHKKKMMQHAWNRMKAACAHAVLVSVNAPEGRHAWTSAASATRVARKLLRAHARHMRSEGKITTHRLGGDPLNTRGSSEPTRRKSSIGVPKAIRAKKDNANMTADVTEKSNSTRFWKARTGYLTNMTQTDNVKGETQATSDHDGYGRDMMEVEPKMAMMAERDDHVEEEEESDVGEEYMKWPPELKQHLAKVKGEEARPRFGTSEYTDELTQRLNQNRRIRRERAEQPLPKSDDRETPRRSAEPTLADVHSWLEMSAPDTARGSGTRAASPAAGGFPFGRGSGMRAASPAATGFPLGDMEWRRRKGSLEPASKKEETPIRQAPASGQRGKETAIEEWMASDAYLSSGEHEKRETRTKEKNNEAELRDLLREAIIECNEPYRDALTECKLSCLKAKEQATKVEQQMTKSYISMCENHEAMNKELKKVGAELQLASKGPSEEWKDMAERMKTDCDEMKADRTKLKTEMWTTMQEQMILQRDRAQADRDEMKTNMWTVLNEQQDLFGKIIQNCRKQSRMK